MYEQKKVCFDALHIQTHTHTLDNQSEIDFLYMWVSGMSDKCVFDVFVCNCRLWLICFKVNCQSIVILILTTVCHLNGIGAHLKYIRTICIQKWKVFSKNTQIILYNYKFYLNLCIFWWWEQVLLKLNKNQGRTLVINICLIVLLVISSIQKHNTKLFCKLNLMKLIVSKNFKYLSSVCVCVSGSCLCAQKNESAF